MSATSSIYADLAASPEPTQVSNQYVWGARPSHRDELVLRDRDADGNGSLEERLYCLMDYFNPVAVVDREGSVVERYAWSAFGRREVMAPDWSTREGSEFGWSFGFHGQFLDGETGYYNYGYRSYSPELGRWLNRDAIGERGGVNLYAFTENDAVNALDWLGLEKKKVGEFVWGTAFPIYKGVSFEVDTDAAVFWDSDTYCLSFEGSALVAFIGGVKFKKKGGGTLFGFGLTYSASAEASFASLKWEQEMNQEICFGCGIEGSQENVIDIISASFGLTAGVNISVKPSVPGFYADLKGALQLTTPGEVGLALRYKANYQIPAGTGSAEFQLVGTAKTDIKFEGDVGLGIYTGTGRGRRRLWGGSVSELIPGWEGGHSWTGGEVGFDNKPIGNPITINW